jgi:hypothetical protein
MNSCVSPESEFDLPEPQKTYLLEEQKQRRAELDKFIDRIERDQRFGLVVTGLMWSWLSTTPSVSASPIGKFVAFLPSLLVAGLWWRWRTIDTAIRGIAVYTEQLEDLFGLPRLPANPVRFDLQLVSWGNGSGVRTWGDNLVIVGIDNKNLLHIRIFDADGKQITDTDEARLTSARLPAPKEKAISFLKQHLPAWLPPHTLTGNEKAELISAATSIVDQQPGPFGWETWLKSPIKKKHKGGLFWVGLVWWLLLFLTNVVLGFVFIFWPK